MLLSCTNSITCYARPRRALLAHAAVQVRALFLRDGQDAVDDGPPVSEARLLHLGTLRRQRGAHGAPDAVAAQHQLRLAIFSN